MNEEDERRAIRQETRAHVLGLLANIETAAKASPIVAIRHPEGALTTGDGRTISCHEYAAELMSQMHAGAVMALPSTRNYDGHLEWDIVPAPASLLVESLRGLAWLLGLTGQELAFVQRLAEKPTDGVGIAAFADWLEEQGRDAEAARMRRAVEGAER